MNPNNHENNNSNNLIHQKEDQKIAGMYTYRPA